MRGQLAGRDSGASSRIVIIAATVIIEPLARRYIDCDRKIFPRLSLLSTAKRGGGGGGVSNNARSLSRLDRTSLAFTSSSVASSMNEASQSHRAHRIIITILLEDETL